MTRFNTDGTPRVEKNTSKSHKCAGDVPAKNKYAPPRRSSREIDKLFARLEFLPTSSPLPTRPRIRIKSEEDLALAVEGGQPLSACILASLLVSSHANKD